MTTSVTLLQTAFSAQTGIAVAHEQPNESGMQEKRKEFSKREPSSTRSSEPTTHYFFSTEANEVHNVRLRNLREDVSLGSARGSRAGDGGLAITNF
jgi:hypothetical protein